MKKLLLLASVSVASFAFSAAAETPHQMNRWPHWYIGLQGFVPFTSESDASINGANVGDINFESGWGGGASLGYKPGNTGTFFDALRFELEYAYRTNDVDTIGGLSTGDDVRSNAFMVNGFYDLDTGTQLIPYVGGGVGVARVRLDAPALGVDDADTNFAYQGMVGVAYAPETVRNTTIGLGYRYFGTSDPSIQGPLGGLEYEYQTHNVELNARFAF